MSNYPSGEGNTSPTAVPAVRSRTGAALAREIHGSPQPSAADIVVAESHPLDYDLWQASKRIRSSELLVRESGVVIPATPCPHGVSTDRPEIEQIGYHTYMEVRGMVEKKQMTDLIAVAPLVTGNGKPCLRQKGAV